MATQATAPVPTPEIPNKLYFRIGDVSRIAGVKPYVLRYWETEFPAIGPKKSGSNHRLYRRKDVELILDIKRLLYQERYTIEGARKHLDALHKSEAASRGKKAPKLDFAPVQDTLPDLPALAPPMPPASVVPASMSSPMGVFSGTMISGTMISGAGVSGASVSGAAVAMAQMPKSEISVRPIPQQTVAERNFQLIRAELRSLLELLSRDPLANR